MNKVILKKHIEYTALLLFLIMAIFSVGFYHADEYFQILEFAQYKLELTKAKDLPWEFKEKIRPTIQVYVVIGLTRFFNFFGIENATLVLLIIRLLTAFFSWNIIKKLNNYFIKEYRFSNLWAKRLSICTFFLWFVPYLSVRFSSENISGILLLFAFYVLTKKRTINNLLIFGALCGLMFFVRFQLAIVITTMYCWVLFVEKEKLSKVVISIISLFLVMCLGVFLDSHFYNEFTFTPYNYFYANIVEGVSANYGTSPFYAYFIFIIVFAVPPISILLLFFLLKGILEYSNKLFVWLVLIFVGVHSIIPHKELRFLFPIIYFFILIAILSAKNYAENSTIKNWRKKVFYVSVFINSILLGFTILPFRTTDIKINMQQFLYRAVKKHQINTIVTTQENPFYWEDRLKMTFYKPLNSKVLTFDDVSNLEAYLHNNNLDKFYFVYNGYGDYVAPFYGYNKELVYNGIVGKQSNFKLKLEEVIKKNTPINSLFQSYKVYLITKK